MEDKFVLRLSPEEKSAFESLSAELREGWSVETEDLDTIERPEEIKMRSMMLQPDDPGVEKAVAAIRSSGSAQECKKELELLMNLPRPVLLDALFTLGATGVTCILRSLLESARTDEDLECVSELTHVRHAMLESNAEVSYS